MDARTDMHMDGQIPPVFYKTSPPSGRCPKMRQIISKTCEKKEVIGEKEDKKGKEKDT